MKLTIKIILPLFIIAIVIAIVANWLPGVFNKEKHNISCSSEVEASRRAGRYTGFGPSNDTELIACYGVITEEMWTEVDNGFSLYDHKNKYEIVPLNHEGHYRLFGDELLVFVKDNRPKDLPGYGVWYFVDGKERPFTYKLYDDIPKYIAIDINSGEVTIYPNDLSKIPETERKIFHELEIRAKN